MYFLQVVTMSGKTWRSRPFVREKADGTFALFRVPSVADGVQDVVLPSVRVPCLEYDFSPYAVKIADDGIDATVESIADYGAEKIAVCKVGDKTVNVFLPEGTTCAAGDNVKLSVNVTELGIVEADRGIRVI